jgi:hypothetical protein
MPVRRVSTFFEAPERLRCAVCERHARGDQSGECCTGMSSTRSASTCPWPAPIELSAAVSHRVLASVTVHISMTRRRIPSVRRKRRLVRRNCNAASRDPSKNV